MSTVTFVNMGAAQEYLCAICLDVMRQPVQIGCGGGHVFCRGCMVQLIQSQSIHNLKCPTCTRHFHHNTLIEIPFIQRKINDLTVKCPHHRPPITINPKINQHKENNNNKSSSPPLRRSKRIQEKHETLSGKKRKRPDYDDESDDDDDDDDDIEILPNRIKIDNIYYCSWIGRFGELSDHINECPLELINCPYSSIGCKTKIKRKNMEIHINECEYCPIICNQCKRTKISRGYLKNHLLNDCIMSMIKCVECEHEMRRKDILHHKKYECGETLIQCEYKRFGCYLIKRKNKIKHNQENIECHLNLIKESHNKLEKQMIELRHRMDEIERNQNQNQNEGQHGFIVQRQPKQFQPVFKRKPIKCWRRRK